MHILETNAKNEKDALSLAVSYLSVDEDQIEVKLIEKGSAGFLGFGEKNPSKYFIYHKPDITPLQVIIKGVLATILHKMGYKVKFVRFETLEEDQKLYVELASPQAGYIIGKRGRTLESLQFLLNMIVEQLTGNPPKILLDISNYRKRRATYLEDLANKMAKSVIKSGRSKLLDSMNPYERRIIHLTLQENEKVSTESQGHGIHKRVKITLNSEFAQVKKEKQTKDPNAPEIGNEILDDEVLDDTQPELDEEKILNDEQPQLEEEIVSDTQPKTNESAPPL